MEGKSMKKIRDEDLDEYKEAFNYFDRDGSGLIDNSELELLLRKLNISIAPYKIKSLKTKYGATIDFEEFQQIVADHSTAQSGAAFLNMLTKRKVEHITGGTSHGSAQGTTHSFSKSESVAFADWMNIQLSEDEELKQRGYLPLNISSDSDALFQKLKNGVLLCKLINATVKDTIDDRVINKNPVSTYAVHENQTLAINSAISIGCRVVNIGAEDLASGKPHLILGLLWQIIRIGLFSHITLTEVPGLRRLLSDGTTEEKDDRLHQISPEEILVLWVNYHLELAGSPRRLSNFGDDIKDSEIYSVLLTRLASLSEISIKQTSYVEDHVNRADEILKNAKTMGCKRFITAKDIIEGNEKLNLAFIANLFNTYPCLPADGDDDCYQEGNDSQYEETREEKTYRNWMNSLGADPYVTWIYTDLEDGHVILQLYDRIHPGIVDWSCVASKQDCKKEGGKGNLEKIANCNYAVKIGKENPFKFRLVGIQGQDIKEGKRMLTLSLLNQMMQSYTLSVLTQLDSDGEKASLNDGDIINWVNDMLKDSSHAIKSFKDSRIATSLPVIDLIETIKAKTVDYRLVNKTNTVELTENEKMQNARYAMSMARKIGAQIYALPEDLVEVKPKMVMTVFACMMVCYHKYYKQNTKDIRPKN